MLFHNCFALVGPCYLQSVISSEVSGLFLCTVTLNPQYDRVKTTSIKQMSYELMF